MVCFFENCHHILKRKSAADKKQAFFQRFQVFIDTFCTCMLYCAMRRKTPNQRLLRRFLETVSSKCHGNMTGKLTGGVSTWQRNVPISPRSCTARRSTASAREWLPPTAARSWPAAAPRAVPVCPTKRNGKRGETLEQTPSGTAGIVRFLRP